MSSPGSSRRRRDVDTSTDRTTDFPTVSDDAIREAVSRHLLSQETDDQEHPVQTDSAVDPVPDQTRSSFPNPSDDPRRTEPSAGDPVDAHRGGPEDSGSNSDDLAFDPMDDGGGGAHSTDDVPEDTSHPYIKITPAREQVVPKQIVKGLYGFHRAGGGREMPFGLAERLPFVSPKTTFEFLIHKPRETQRFDFYLGVHPYDVRAFKNLANNISAMYPDTFTFEVASFSPRDAFTRQNERLAGLRALAELEGIEELEGLQGFRRIEYALEELHEGDPDGTEESESADHPEASDDESDMEMPSMVRWVGTEAKNNDWMTLLSRFSEVDLTAEDGYRSPLSVLLEQATGTDEPFVFQAIFSPRRDWTKEAEAHKRNLKMGVSGMKSAFMQELWRELLGTSDDERREIHRADTPEQIGGTIKNGEPGNSTQLPRMGQIDIKQPTVTFDLSLRAAGPPDVVGSVAGAFNSLSGPYYGIEGKALGVHQREFTRLCDASLTHPGLRTRLQETTPILVASPDELANFVTVPNTATLPKASRGASGGTPDVRSPLTATDENLLAKFDTGMCIGSAVTAPRERSNIDIRLTADQLIHHVLRAASTGSGKSTAIINDVLGAYEELDGPVFVFDKKGGAMFDEYKRSHFKRFGNLDDVVHLSIPGRNGELPAFPFFDIRPQIAAGMSREAAVQEKVDRYGELISYVIGREANENAFVANEILANLIVALFDPVHGSDAYAISDLLGAAYRMQVDHEIPEVSDPELEATLIRHFNAEEYRFQTSIDAVMNRITKLKERDFIWRMMNFVPEWDAESEAYTEDQMLFNLNEILDSKRVVLIDTGEFRPASSNLFTVLMLDYIWSWVRLRKRWERSVPSPDDGYAINLIIDEAAPIMQASLLRDEMIPDAREFALAFELIVHFPEQVKRDALDTRAYKEILRNINTKLIGKLALDDELAVTLFHEELDADDLADRIASLPRGEWLAQLPDTGFMTDTPELVTLQPLGIPPGHSESDAPVDNSTRSTDTGLSYLHVDQQQRSFTRRRYCLVPGINSPPSAAQRAARFGAGVMNSEAADASSRESSTTQNDSGVHGDRRDEVDPDHGDGGGVSSGQDSGPRHRERDDPVDSEASSFEEMVDRDRQDSGSHASSEREHQRRDTDDSNTGVWTNEYGTTLGTGDAGPVNPTRPSNGQDEEDGSLGDGTDDSSSDANGDGFSNDPPSEIDDEPIPEDLSDDEVRFLRNVVKALNGELEGYDLTESMTKIRNLSGSNIDEDKLVEAGYLEHHWAGKKYYWITEKGQDAVNRKLYTGRNYGDLNEKTIHKVFSEYFARYLEYSEGLSVEKYYEPMGGGIVFDVAGFSTNEEGNHDLTVIGEVLTSVKPARVVKHFDDFCTIDGVKKFWVVQNYDVAHELVRALETAGRIQNAPWKDVKNYEKITEEAFGSTDEWRILGANNVVEFVKEHEADSEES